MLVIGSPGAGKSTFSRELARQTGLTLTHLDAEYWQPGWVRPPKEVWEARVCELIAADAWILDGNYTSTVPLRAERADTVIVLDYPRLLCLFRAVSRAVLNRRTDRMNLGKEPLNLEFLRFIWNFKAVHQRQLIQLEALPHLTLIRLHSDAQTQAWLGTISGR